ncbi:MAG: hypothetical protein WAU39_06000 [Polyangiales bacterium]
MREQLAGWQAMACRTNSWRIHGLGINLRISVDLHPASLVVLPLAKRETAEIVPVSEQAFASDFATRDQTSMISDSYQWRRWESNSRELN